MTAEQLEELLGKVTQGEWVDDGTLTLISGDKIVVIIADGDHNNYGSDFDWGEAEANARLVSLLPKLARSFIEAEMLVSQYLSRDAGSNEWWEKMDDLISAYREASK